MSTYEGPDTTLLKVALTPELLLAVANQARDLFEYIDGPLRPGEQFDESAEETAELLEELVRINAPELVTQLAWHDEGDDERPRWRIRHEDGWASSENLSRKLERDPDEPIAHIVRGIDQLMNATNAEPLNDALAVAEAALHAASKNATAAQRTRLNDALALVEWCVA